MQVSGLVENPCCLFQPDHLAAKVCSHVCTIYVHQQLEGGVLPSGIKMN